MTWIALKMLTGDKAKFFGIVLGLTFAALLITQQGSIFCGLMSRTAGQIYDITGADLWVMDPNVRYIDDVKPMIETNLYRVRGVEGVEWAVPLYKGIARAKINSIGTETDPETGGPAIDPETGRPKTRRHEVIEQVILLGLDDASLVGAPPPERMLAGSLERLRRPDGVIIDYSRLSRLFPGDPGPPEGATPAQLRRYYGRFLGRDLEMNDHRAVIVGVCEASRTFQSNAVVYTTYSRAKQFIPRERKMLSYVLVKVQRPETTTPVEPAEASAWGEVGRQVDALRDRARATFETLPQILSGRPDPDPIAKEVALRIESRTGLRARTSQEFIWDTIDYFLKYTGIPINFGITAMLGFLVGTAIAGQTFYLFTIDNLKQFGALKAMGASNLAIVRMILIQAVIVGLLGYGMGVGLAALFGESSKGGELAFYTPWQLLPITGAAIVLICVLASLISVRRVVVLEPAVVFR